MMRAIVCGIATNVVLAGPAAAHAPYFGAEKACVLPDGSPARLRLLFGDGILARDPVTLLLVDANDQVLAKSGRLSNIILDQRNNGPCQGYVAVDGAILEADRTSLGSRPLPRAVVGVRDDSDALWQIEADKRSWGFSTRPATWPETFRANLAAARQHPLQAVVAFCLGFLIVGAGFVVFGRSDLSGIPAVGERIVRIALGVVMALGAAFVWFVLMEFSGGLSEPLLLTLPVAGALVALASRRQTN